MAGRLNEVQTSMDAVVHDFLAIDPVLLLEIRVEPSFDVLNDGSPAVRTHQHVMQRLRGDNTVPFIVVNKVPIADRM